jgi:hypothetical protein
MAATAAPAKVEGKEMLKEDLSRMEGAYGAQMIGKLKQMGNYHSLITSISSHIIHYSQLLYYHLNTYMSCMV